MLRLGSWNYRAGMSTPERQQLVCQAAQSYSIDILAVQEAALQRSVFCGSYRILVSPPARNSNQQRSARNSGVALVLSLAANTALQRWEVISPHILVATFRGPFVNTVVIAAYAPDSGLGRLETQQFRDQLHAAISDVASRHFLVVLGDFNARVGSACSSSAADSYGGALGQHGVGERNTEGRKLLDLCAATKLSVSNTVFQPRPTHKLSFRSSRNQEHLLDFVLVRRKFLYRVRDVRVLRDANGCGEYTQSDHHLVCATICLRLKAHCPRAPQPDVAALQDPETAARFADAAAAKLPSLPHLQQQPAAAI
jgi:endonuclease/exonuclease/phosphatase family metal-dependent hydrolase